MSIDWLYPKQNCRYSLFWRAEQGLQGYFSYLLNGSIVDTTGNSKIYEHRILALLNDSKWISSGIGMGIGFFLCRRPKIYRIDWGHVGLYICILIGLG